jgi:hypothetical protein
VRQRRADPQSPARRAAIGDLLLRLVEIGQDAPRRQEIGLAFRRHRQRPRGAQQQPHTQPRLDPVDRPAHCRGTEPSARPAAEKLPPSCTAANTAISRARSAPVMVSSAACIFAFKAKILRVRCA